MRLRNGKSQVGGRDQRLWALAGVLIAVHRNGNVMTSRALGEEGESWGKTFQLPLMMGRQPKACKPLDACLVLALPGESGNRKKEGKKS